MACARAITDILRREGDIADVIAEPMRAVPLIPPPGFWAEIRRACDETGTLLIFDEIPTGLGKTGRLFASDHENVVPDITVLGKVLGGAVLPIAALLARADLDVAQPWSIGHYTHEKNPVTARAALAVLETIEAVGLVGRAATMGARMLDGLRALAARHPCLVRPLGRGLLAGVDIIVPASGLPDPGAAEAIRARAFDLGVNLKTSRGHTLTLSSPLVIAENEVDLVLDRLARAVAPAG